MRSLKIAVLEGDDINETHDDFFEKLAQIGVNVERKDFDNLYSNPEKLDELVDFQPEVIAFLTMNLPTENSLNLSKFLFEYDITSIDYIVSISNYCISRLDTLSELIMKYEDLQDVVFYSDTEDFIDFCKDTKE